MPGACALVRNSECCGSKHVSFLMGLRLSSANSFFSSFSFFFFFFALVNLQLLEKGDGV